MHLLEWNEKHGKETIDCNYERASALEQEKFIGIELNVLLLFFLFVVIQEHKAVIQDGIGYWTIRIINK